MGVQDGAAMRWEAPTAQPELPVSPAEAPIAAPKLPVSPSEAPTAVPELSVSLSEAPTAQLEPPVWPFATDSIKAAT